jgi:photosystem II stability/assembly factor-like uncharacterized protein
MPVTVTGFTAVDAGKSDSLFASTSCGPCTSLDGGQTWQPVEMAGNVPMFALGSFPLPAGPDVLLAGIPSGVIRSLDEGRTWQSTLDSSAVTAIAINWHRNGGTVTLVGTESDGIFRSNDLGEQWTSASPGLLDLEIIALAMSADFPSDNTVLAGTPSGLYRSRNGGRAWRPLSFPERVPVVQCVAFQQGRRTSPRIWAGTEVAGLWSSRDGGSTWVIDEAIGRIGISAIVVSRRDPAIMLIATDNGVYRSADAGQSWAMVHPAQDVLSLMSCDQGNGETLLAGCVTGGILRSTDTGITWQASELS